jgi:hypothetical protein
MHKPKYLDQLKNKLKAKHQIPVGNGLKWIVWYVEVIRPCGIITTIQSITLLLDICEDCIGNGNQGEQLYLSINYLIIALLPLNIMAGLYQRLT